MSESAGARAQKYYPYEFWNADCKWYFTSQKDRIKAHLETLSVDEIEDYFHRTRTDPAVADYCFRRFRAAIIYLEDNLHSLNFGRAAVVGDQQSLVKRIVYDTLYRFFAGRTDAEMDSVVSIKDFIRELESTV